MHLQMIDLVNRNLSSTVLNKLLLHYLEKIQNSKSQAMAMLVHTKAFITCKIMTYEGIESLQIVENQLHHCQAHQ